MTLAALSVILFVAIASLLFFFLYIAYPKKSVLKERIESLERPRTEEISLLEAEPSQWQKFLGRLGKSVPMRPQDLGKYQKMLVAAGIKKERLPIFMGAKVLLTVLLPLAYVTFYGMPFEKSATTRLLISVCLAIAGYLLPSYWLMRRMKQRQTGIFHALPDLLDLMTICVEAGMSMDAAMIKVCEDQQFQKTQLAKEVRIAINETRTGKPRLDALRDMGERTMVDDLKSFAAMLVQTERLGTSLGESLRVFSDSLRTIRRQVAEEAAAKTAVKLIFPLVFFIFPAILIVILGPGMIRIARLFSEL